MDIFDDKLIDPKKNDFPEEIGEAGKFGIIEEEEKGNKKRPGLGRSAGRK